MNGIETAELRPRTVDEGQVTTDSASVLEDLPSLSSRLALEPSSLRALLDQPSVLQEHI